MVLYLSLQQPILLLLEEVDQVDLLVEDVAQVVRIQFFLLLRQLVVELVVMQLQVIQVVQEQAEEQIFHLVLQFQVVQEILLQYLLLKVNQVDKDGTPTMYIK